MASAFLRHRSGLAREEAVRNLEVAVQRLGNLVLNVSALADGYEARPADGLEQRRERQERVAVLRAAAQDGQQSIGRLTAHLLRGRSAEPAVDLIEPQRSAADGS